MIFWVKIEEGLVYLYMQSRRTNINELIIKYVSEHRIILELNKKKKKKKYFGINPFFKNYY